MAQSEERGGVLLPRRSPVLREFSKRFLEWVDNQSMLKQKSKDYYANGWRLLADTDVAGMRLDAICQDDTGMLSFSGGPSNHNNALRTLRRMLGKAEEWRVLRAAPKIKLQQERERERISRPAQPGREFPKTNPGDSAAHTRSSVAGDSAASPGDRL